MTTVEELQNVGTPEQVFASLGDPDKEHYSSETITRKLTTARIATATIATGSNSDDLLRESVIAIASYQTFIATPKVVNKSAANVSKDISFEDQRGELKDTAEDAKNRISKNDAILTTY